MLNAKESQMREGRGQAAASDGMTIPYFIAWFGFRAIYKFYFRCRVYNAERVPGRGGVILASNHASFLDPPLVGSGLLRDINYLGRENLFRFPVMGWVLRHWQVVPVDRDGGGAAGLRAILDRLLAGGAIILFPEGTRTRDGKLQPARSGIGLTVIKSTAPVVPVRVFGTFEAYGRHLVFPRPYRVAVKYGQPMFFTQLPAEAKTCSKARLKEIYQQIADELMRAIGRLEPYSDVSRFP
ncbi:MAG: lysophospholipid acyltransferase family protein [Verrucomicrobia bacterium]|nr:lysophospholipid acyltransferase family protein [Verrucomicrobiota bacterium]